MITTTTPSWLQGIAMRLGAMPHEIVEQGIRRGWVQRPQRPADPYAGPDFLHGERRAAEMLGVSAATVCRLVASGKLATANPGETPHVFRLEALVQYKYEAALAAPTPNPSGAGWVIGLRNAGKVAGLSYRVIQQQVAKGKIPFVFGANNSMWFRREALLAVKQNGGANHA